MSKRMYAHLLLLYPSGFLSKYEGEALQLIRDRLCDGKGLFKKARLWWDLVVDLLAGLPSAYGNSYTVTDSAPLSFHPRSSPSFEILDGSSLGFGSILAGGTTALLVLAAFALLLSRPIANHPFSDSNGRLTPTEAVMERLNQVPSVASVAGSRLDSATPASEPGNRSTTRPWTPSRDLFMVMKIARDEQGVPQAPPSERKLNFDVASIRQNKTGAPPYSNFPLGPGPVFGAKGGLLIAKNQTLLGYIFFAFKPDLLQSQQFQRQLPEWVKTTSYDIEARASGSPTKDDMRLMMQSLLEERFHLVIHRETREAPVYALVLAKPGALGPRLKPHPADDPDCRKTKFTKTTTGTDPTCGAGSPIVPKTPGDFATAVYNMPMDAVAVELSRTAGLGRVTSMSGRRVVNRTGLTGAYDYTLEFAPEQTLDASSDVTADSEAGGPSFIAAMKNQLGLKLVPQKLPVEVIIVDRIERPSEN